MARKLNSKEWEFEVKRAMKVREAQKKGMRRQKFRFFERFIGSFMPIPLIIGLLAMVLIITLYGWKEFFKFLLSWIVSLTIVATGAYYLWKRYEREL